MRKLLIILLITNISIGFTQGLRNYDAKIVVEPKTNIYIQGGSNGSFTNDQNGTIDNDGEISLEGNWNNNSSNNVFINTNTTGSVIFSGNSEQFISGNKTTFENIEIKNSNYVRLQTNTDILYNLTLTNGIFDLKDKVADLGSTGKIVNESETNRVTATDGTGTTVNNTGIITAIYTLNNVSNHDPANLGIIIKTNQNLGDVVVTRGHQIQTGSFNGSTNSGVARYYIVPGIGKLDVTNKSVDMHYWEAELNGLDENTIEGYNWVTEGSSSSWWTPLDGSVDVGNNLFTTSGNPYDDYFNSSNNFSWSDKFTLGSSNTPLPVKLTDFSVECNQDGANIKWTTSSETNNAYFTIEQSLDAVNFNKLIDISGNGNSNQLIKYTYLDKNINGLKYYKLLQTDYNGLTTEFKTISANCFIQNNNDIIIYPNPAKDKISIKTNAGFNYKELIITDVLGKILLRKDISNIESDININISNLSDGTYNLMLKSDKNIIVKRLVKANKN